MFMDKFLSFMQGGGDDYYEDEEEFLDEEDEETPETRSRFGSRREEREEEPPVRSSKSKITPMRSVKKKDASGREICMFTPRGNNSNESCEIIDALLDDRSVVLNLEGMPEDAAQTIVNTVSGACYALKGNMQKISNYIFIIAPRSVSLSDNSVMPRDAFEQLPTAVNGIRY